MRWQVATYKDKGETKEARFANGDVSAIRSDCKRFVIAKNFVDGCTLLSLYDGDEFVKVDEDKEVLMAIAEERGKA